MSDLLSEPLSLPLLERHRTPPSGEEILDRFVERYASRSLGDRVASAPPAPVTGPTAGPEEAPDEPTVLFTVPLAPEAPAPSPATAGEEEATRVLEVPPEVAEEGGGTPTMAFEAVPGEAVEEATRVLEVPPDTEEGGPEDEPSGTPTVAMVPGDASKKRKKRRHR